MRLNRIFLIYFLTCVAYLILSLFAEAILQVSFEEIIFPPGVVQLSGSEQSIDFTSIIRLTFLVLAIISGYFYFIRSPLNFFSTPTSRAEEASYRNVREIENLERTVRNLQTKFERQEIESRSRRQSGENVNADLIEAIIRNEVDLSEIIRSHFDSISDNISVNHLRDQMERIRENLIDYRKSNRSQYILNLFAGLFLGISAIFAAGYLLIFEGDLSIIDQDGKPNLARALAYYVPWITIIVVIEFLAIFFLKLYRENIHTERYLRDEITSIGLKIAGVENCLRMDEAPLSRKITEKLFDSERHQILQKGQTSVEVEKARLDKESFKESIDFIATMTPWDTAAKAMATAKAKPKVSRPRRSKTSRNPTSK